MAADMTKRKRSVRIVPGNQPLPQETLGLLVREVYRALSRMLQAKIAREGVSIGMWFVLRALWEEDGLSQSELSSRVGINGPTTVISLNAMQKAGLVVRVPHESDRRKTNIFLTDYGRGLREKLWPLALEVNTSCTRGMKEEQVRTLCNLLARVRNNLT
jgi:DNA-binding MarR family transcriptional regulator